MTTKISNEQHAAFYKELTDVMQKHASDLPAEELLAVASNLVGKLVAMQDQRVYTKDMVMTIVVKNIEIGNLQMVNELMTTRGNA